MWEKKLGRGGVKSCAATRQTLHGFLHTYLHPMVVGIGHDDAVRVRDGDVVRMFELALFLAAGAKLANK